MGGEEKEFEGRKRQEWSVLKLAPVMKEAEKEKVPPRAYVTDPEIRFQKIGKEKRRTIRGKGHPKKRKKGTEEKEQNFTANPQNYGPTRKSTTKGTKISFPSIRPGVCKGNIKRRSKEES